MFNAQGGNVKRTKKIT